MHMSEEERGGIMKGPNLETYPLDSGLSIGLGVRAFPCYGVHSGSLNRQWRVERDWSIVGPSRVQHRLQSQGCDV